VKFIFKSLKGELSLDSGFREWPLSGVTFGTCFTLLINIAGKTGEAGDTEMLAQQLLKD
jgi:hypothetical protein